MAKGTISEADIKRWGKAEVHILAGGSSGFPSPRIQQLAEMVVDLNDDEAEVYASLIGEIRAQRAQERANRIATLCAQTDWQVIADILGIAQPDPDEVLDTLRDAGFVRADVRAVYRTAYLRFADRVAIRPLEQDHPTYLAGVEADLKEMGLA